MYHIYTVTDNSAVCDLPAQLNGLIESIIASDVKSINLDDVDTYYYIDDWFADTKHFFQTVVQQSKADRNKYDSFTRFFEQSLIYNFQQSRESKYPKLTGLSLFIMPPYIQTSD